MLLQKKKLMVTNTIKNFKALTVVHSLYSRNQKSRSQINHGGAAAPVSLLKIQKINFTTKRLSGPTPTSFPEIFARSFGLYYFSYIGIKSW